MGGFTLVEIMVSLTLLTTIMLGFLSTFVQSRRVTETSVMHAAATSLVYGLIEQMKGLDYTTLIPSTVADPEAPTGSVPPYIRVRIDQDQTVWLQSVYTLAGSTPQAPTSTPNAAATAASLGAVDNIIGPLPLSSVTGTVSQNLTINLWIWIDEMPSDRDDVMEVKRITVVYTYALNDGGTIRTIRDREVFIRTRFDL
jgi:Tfp pilus assembly protein PilV